MSSDIEAYKRRKAMMSPKEYMDIQREAGSCIPQFRDNLLTCSKFGFFVGIPFGLYVGYRYHPRAFKPFIGTSLVTSLYTFMTFTGIGIVVASYNCLRVYR